MNKGVGFPQWAPQSIEVPLNIEAQRIVSPFSTLLSHVSNPALLKHDFKLLISLDVGRPFANAICMILIIITNEGSTLH